MNSKLSAEKRYDIAWAYYELHMERRLKFFKFFLTFLTFLAGGLFAILSTAYSQESVHMYLMGIVISILLTLCAYVFRKIDERNRDFREVARETLAKIEREDANSCNGIFTADLEKRKEKDGVSTKLFVCLLWTFFVAGLLSIVLFIGLLICLIIT